MIFATVKMKQLIAVVTSKDTDRVSRELLREGTLHLLRVSEEKEDWKAKVTALQPRVSEERIREMQRKTESFLTVLKTSLVPPLTFDVNKIAPLDLQEIGKYLDELASRVQSVKDRQRRVQEEIPRLGEVKRQFERFRDIGRLANRQTSNSILNIQAGTAPMARLEVLESEMKAFPSAVVTLGEEGELTHLLIVSMKRDQGRIQETLKRNGWVAADLPQEMRGYGRDVVQGFEERVVALREQEHALDGELRSLVEREGERLREIWRGLGMNGLLFRIQSYFSKTSRTVIFSGWIPAEKQRRMETAIREVTEGRCYLEWNDPDIGVAESRGKVPVLFQNPGFLAPFQMLVRKYAVPEYGTVDPTPLVAVVYLIMFGLMFPDAGQGTVLVILGLIGTLIYRGKNEARYQLSGLVAWCGLSAVVAGLLFGSYFGMGWFEPLWFDFHAVVSGHFEGQGFVKDIYGVLAITIYFGISVIAIGLVLNFINTVVRREWRKLLFDKGGILGAWIYGGGIYTAFFFVRHAYKELPDGSLLFWLLGLPALAFALAGPVEFLARKKEHSALRLTPFALVQFVLEWFVELLEIFGGYLANTLSFMRIAGLGIAHASLMMVFFEIARMVGGGGAYTIWSILVLILGNLLVIALEGLSAGIQSLRLNYYEFFSKYFVRSTSAYSPVSLKSPAFR